MAMLQIENVVSDRGSKYAVSGNIAKNRSEVQKLISILTARKKYARASHNTWAIIFSSGEQVKQDDGESGAGSIMLKMLEREHLLDHLVIVTRWYGGVNLGADRFRHVKSCVQMYVRKLRSSKQY